MADNYTTAAGSGGNTYASDDVGGTHYPIVKVAQGALDTATLVSDTDPLPIDIREINSATVLTGGGVELGALRVTIANDSTGVLSVDDNNANLSIDFAGTAPTLNTGTVDAGTLRVTHATDVTVPVSPGGTGEFHLISSFTRNEAFGTKQAACIGGEFDDLSPVAATEGNVSPARITAQRAIHANLRKNDGTEIASGGGTEANALRVTIASDSTGVVSVDDNNANLSIDLAGTTPSLDDGVTDPGTLRVTIGNAHIADFDTGAPTDNTPCFGLVVPDSGGPTVVSGDNINGLDVDVTRVQGSVAVTSGASFTVQEDGAALTALQLIDDPVFADDAAFTLGSSKVMVAGAIRDDTLSALTAVEGDAVPLRVNSTGALHVTGGGGGTEYVEDDAAPANPTAAAISLVRQDTPATLTSLNGDIVTQRGTNYGAAYCQILTSSGSFVDSFGGSGGTSQADESAFTEGTTNMTPIGGVLNDTITSDPTEDQAACVRITAKRAFHVNLRNTAGTEIGTTADPVSAGIESVTPLTATGTITATNGTVQIDVGGYGSVGIQISGTWTATVVFEATVDGTNWSTLQVVPLGNSAAQTAAAVNGAWTLECGGLDKVRCRASSFTSGTIQVDFQANISGGKSQVIREFARDLSSGAADEGVQVLAVRRDADTSAVGSDGDYAPLLVDATGKLKVEIFDGGDTHSVAGSVAHDAAASGANPVLIGLRANLDEPSTAVADGDNTYAWGDQLGRIVALLGHSDPEPPVTANGSAAGTTVIAAPGAGVSLYIQKVVMFNSAAAENIISLRDGAAGTIRFTGNLAANGGGCTADFGSRGWKLTANTALVADIGSATGYVNVTEYYIAA